MNTSLYQLQPNLSRTPLPAATPNRRLVEIPVNSLYLFPVISPSIIQTLFVNTWLLDENIVKPRFQRIFTA